MARLDVEAATYPAAIDAAVARALWDTDNQKCFDLTMLAMSNCPEGQTVLSAFEYDPAILDIANPAKYADDGRGAFYQLEHNAIMESLQEHTSCVFCST